MNACPRPLTGAQEHVGELNDFRGLGWVLNLNCAMLAGFL